MNFPEDCFTMLKVNRSKNNNLNTMYSYSIYQIIEKLPLHNSGKMQLFRDLSGKLNNIFWCKEEFRKVNKFRKEENNFNDYELDLFNCLLYYRSSILDKTQYSLYKILKIYRKEFEEILGGNLPKEFIQKIKENFSEKGD